MRIAMVGAGYVGLVSGACLADFGHEVVCIDKDAAKIAALREGQAPIYEPGLSELVVANQRAGRLSFTTDIAEGMRGAQAAFIAVGTPTLAGDGAADMRYVYEAAREIADAIDSFVVVVNKSTSPIGTCDEIERLIGERVRSDRFVVVSNPEFLREGAAIDDFKKPDRVVIGVEDEAARLVMREIYRPLERNGSPIVCTSRRTAELIKYAANVYPRDEGHLHQRDRRLVRKGRRRRARRRQRHRPRQAHRPAVPQSRPRFRRLVLSQGHAGADQARRRGALADAPGRNAGRGQREAQDRDGAQDRQGVRRLGQGQDDRRARPDLQAQHRRHARRPQPGHRPHSSGRGRADRRLRPRRRQVGRGAAAGGRIRQRPLRLPRRAPTRSSSSPNGTPFAPSTWRASRRRCASRW